MNISRQTKTERYILKTLPALYISMRRDGAAFLADNNGTICTVTNATWGVQGRTFVGNGFINCGTGASVTGDITISAWIKTNTTDNRFIAQKYNGGSPYNGYGFRITAAGDGDTNKLSFLDGSASFLAETNIIVVDDTWHHVAVTGSGTSGKFYVDGVAGSTFTFTAIAANPSEVLYIGANEGSGSFFVGTIGEIRIYNRALSAVEMRGDYLATKWRYGK